MLVWKWMKQATAMEQLYDQSFKWPLKKMQIQSYLHIFSATSWWLEKAWWGRRKTSWRIGRAWRAKRSRSSPTTLRKTSWELWCPWSQDRKTSIRLPQNCKETMLFSTWKYYCYVVALPDVKCGDAAYGADKVLFEIVPSVVWHWLLQAEDHSCSFKAVHSRTEKEREAVKRHLQSVMLCLLP